MWSDHSEDEEFKVQKLRLKKFDQSFIRVQPDTNKHIQTIQTADKQQAQFLHTDVHYINPIGKHTIYQTSTIDIKSSESLYKNGGTTQIVQQNQDENRKTISSMTANSITGGGGAVRTTQETPSPVKEGQHYMVVEKKTTQPLQVSEYFTNQKLRLNQTASQKNYQGPIRQQTEMGSRRATAKMSAGIVGGSKKIKIYIAPDVGQSEDNPYLKHARTKSLKSGKSTNKSKKSIGNNNNKNKNFKKAA